MTRGTARAPHNAAALSPFPCNAAALLCGCCVAARHIAAVAGRRTDTTRAALPRVADYPSAVGEPLPPLPSLPSCLHAVRCSRFGRAERLLRHLPLHPPHASSSTRLLFLFASFRCVCGWGGGGSRGAPPHRGLTCLSRFPRADWSSARGAEHLERCATARVRCLLATPPSFFVAVVVAVWRRTEQGGSPGNACRHTRALAWAL